MGVRRLPLAGVTDSPPDSCSATAARRRETPPLQPDLRQPRAHLRVTAPVHDPTSDRSLDPPQPRMNAVWISLRRNWIALHRDLVAHLQPTARRAVYVRGELVSTFGIEWAGSDEKSSGGPPGACV